jgi:Tol biopolymer transport system component
LEIKCWGSVYLSRGGVNLAERFREELRVYNFATGESKSVLSIERSARYPAVSPEGRTIIYEQTDQAGSDLMLVENFR